MCENDIDIQWLRENFIMPVWYYSYRSWQLQEEKKEYWQSTKAILSYIEESLFETDMELVQGMWCKRRSLTRKSV